ncbi:hypothetical protein ARSQ2_02394 [Arsenophonus endosymbiont of Bemisia tabaci Q2]|nr:hypothetical protein ARSQ2_02394 [Arsenophonus endosymbiont of Bemisia tabaci Q2]
MGIFKDKNLYLILNGSYNSILNKYIVKDKNYRKYLSIFLSIPLFLLETSSTHKIYYDNNNYKDLLSTILQ